jgi:hypothetical protein
MKRILFTVLAVFLCIAHAAPAFAAGAATKFIVTVRKLELKDVSGKWVTLAEPDTTTDLLADEPLLLMTNDGSVPPGTYVNFRITLSETVQFSGKDDQNKTKEGGILTLGGTASKASDISRNDITMFRQDAPTCNTAVEGLMTQYLDLDFQDRDDVMEITGRRPFAKPVIVKEKSVIKISMGLDLKESVHYAWPDYFSGIPSAEAMYFLPPKDVSEVTVKSDTTTVLTTGEAIEWSF